MVLLAAVWAPLAVFLTLGSASAQTANSQPAFPSSEDGARSVAENAAAGADGDASVGAMDADSDVLTYTLGGGDAASFHDARVALQAAPGMIRSKPSLRVVEGDTATYTVKLTVLPTSNVVISVTKSGSSDVTVSAATLTFTPSNWNTAQTVTVAVAHDADARSDAAIITHAVVAAESADEYDYATSQMAVFTIDDETAGVTVSASALSVVEGGSATYAVKLTVPPISNVVISVTKSGSSDVTVSAATLTFTPSNWNTAQTVTVAAAHDADARHAETASISHLVLSISSSNEYVLATIDTVAVTVTDDDTYTVTVSSSTLTVAEGDIGSYTVILDARPSSGVVIKLTSDNADVTAPSRWWERGDYEGRVTVVPVARPVLIFTPNDWNTAQTVTVAAAQDADALNETATIRHTVVAAESADEYDNASIAAVTVTVTDDDTATPPSGVRGSSGGGGSSGVRGSSGGGSSDQTPTFASRTVGDLIYTVGEDLGTVSLPPAVGGDGGLRYSLSPGLPPGLRFNSDRTITGTPSAALPRTRFAYTATDSDGDSVDLRFFVTVNERPVTNVASGSYDVDNNEVVDRDETIAAVADYFASRIAKNEVLAVIQLYFSG